MSSNNRLNVLLPGGMGVAGKFKHIVSPRRFVRLTPKEGSLSGGFLLLRMTSKELLKVHNIVGQLQRGYPDGFPDLEWQYGFLTQELEALQQERKNTNVLNFPKRNQIRQSAADLYKAGDKLYNSVKAVSSKAAEELSAWKIANAGVEEVEAARIAPNEQVMGFCLDEPLDQETASMLADGVSFCTAREEPYTDSISLSEADDHTLVGDIPCSGVVSSAETLIPASSGGSAARAENSASRASNAPDSCVIPKNSASGSSFVSPINMTGGQSVPSAAPNPAGDSNPPGSGYRSGEENTSSASPPTAPNTASTDIQRRVANFANIWPYIAAAALTSPTSPQPFVNFGEIKVGNVYIDSIHSPNSVGPSQTNGGSQNSGAINNNLPPPPYQAP